jgi:rhodanese-related sulfurtransferase
MARRTVDDLLTEARSRIRRLTPREAAAAVERGALLVDVRSPDRQTAEGRIPGALSYPSDVVLWRLDPDSPSASEKLALDREIIVFCYQGYTSSFVAAQLQEIGFANVADIDGGIEAWAAAGLPFEPAIRADAP